MPRPLVRAGVPFHPRMTSINLQLQSDRYGKPEKFHTGRYIAEERNAFPLFVFPVRQFSGPPVKHEESFLFVPNRRVVVKVHRLEDRTNDVFERKSGRHEENNMSTSQMVFKVLSRTFLIAILSFTCGLLADTATVDGYTWTYHVVDGQAEIGTTQYCAAISPEPTGPVTIPSSLDGYPVTSIGLAAFNCCSGLTKVTIPNGVTTIGEYAFTGCKNLENVFIPGSVTNIGFRAFNGARLTNITVDTANRVYSSRNGLLLNKEGTVLIYGVYGGEDGVVEIPFGVTCIEDSAFVGCGDLTRVMIPSSVTCKFVI